MWTWGRGGGGRGADVNRIWGADVDTVSWADVDRMSTADVDRVNSERIAKAVEQSDKSLVIIDSRRQVPTRTQVYICLGLGSTSA